MPAFLEAALKHEAAKKGLKGDHADRYVWGFMNAHGYVKGNKITEKGERLQEKHDADMKKKKKKDGPYLNDHRRILVKRDRNMVAV